LSRFFRLPARKVGRTLALGAALLLALSLAACSSVGYYLDSVVGHLRVLEAARPMDDWVADPSTPEDLRQRLIEVQGIRRYAIEKLDLPDNKSYRSYADLHRPFVVWNVFATPALSLDLREWCFPVAGCVKYRGYFNREDADRYGDALKSEGLDVQVAGIPAYSTLGFTPDPVLSTFIHFPEGEVARLIFHELAHQKIYLAGDTTFNESYATTVEEIGVERWLADQNDPAKSREYQLFENRRRRFLDLLKQSRSELETLYASHASDTDKTAAKQQIFADLKLRYEASKDDHRDPLYQYKGYDNYFAKGLNNANLAAIATYTRLGPAFVKLLAECDNDLPRFFAAVKGLTELSPQQRDQRMQQLMDGKA
jgi:predicted aminopeptidase